MVLIPGLPDDLARECLIRVPFNSFRSVLFVCKAWKREIRNPNFHIRRRKSGHTRPVFVLVGAHSADRHNMESGESSPQQCNYTLTVFDPESRSWTRLPLGPSLLDEFSYFSISGIVAVGFDIIVMTDGHDSRNAKIVNSFPMSWGYVNKDGPTFKTTIQVFDLLTGEWRRGANIPKHGRNLFGFASDPIHRQVLVAGGHSYSKRFLRSALMYDVEKDTWAHLPDMEKGEGECDVVFNDGRFHVAHKRSADVESLDIDTLEWISTENVFLEASENDTHWVTWNVKVGQNVSVLRGDEEEWEVVAKVPDEVQPIRCVMASLDQIVVMRSNCRPAYMLDLKSRAWTRVDLPDEYANDRISYGCCIEL